MNVFDFRDDLARKQVDFQLIRLLVSWENRQRTKSNRTQLLIEPAQIISYSFFSFNKSRFGKSFA